MNKAGELTVIVGGMFSGKSTELQRQGKRHELAGRNVKYLKPDKDDRYTPEAISTHDGKNVTAVVVPSGAILSNYVSEDVHVVCIDEVQFFDRGLLTLAVDRLLRRGVHVICSGLDVDRFGVPFGAVPFLMAQAEHVIKLKAVCSGCGEDAWVSAGNFTSDSQIEIGEKDKYTPLCRTCYYKKANLI